MVYNNLKINTTEVFKQENVHIKEITAYNMHGKEVMIQSLYVKLGNSVNTREVQAAKIRI
jgi:hypothetical protein